MFNTSIETSMFPDSWKIARVTPIYKNGDRADKSNYRPISVLPVISRLFEKLVTNQVYQHMEDNGLFSSGQSAYLRLHSTVTHLLKDPLLTMILCALIEKAKKDFQITGKSPLASQRIMVSNGSLKIQMTGTMGWILVGL